MKLNNLRDATADRNTSLPEDESSGDSLFNSDEISMDVSRFSFNILPDTAPKRFALNLSNMNRTGQIDPLAHITQHDRSQ
jgi:hypothetical protein